MKHSRYHRSNNTNSSVLNFYRIWVFTTVSLSRFSHFYLLSPPFSSVLLSSSLSCCILYSILLLPLFSYLSVSLSLLLSFFCPCTSSSFHLSAISIHLHSSISSLCPIKTTLSLSWLYCSFFFFFLQTINLYWQWPPSHTSAIKAFQYSLIQFHRKCPLKDLVRTESLNVFFVRTERGRLDVLNHLTLITLNPKVLDLLFSGH